MAMTYEEATNLLTPKEMETFRNRMQKSGQECDISTLLTYMIGYGFHEERGRDGNLHLLKTIVSQVDPAVLLTVPYVLKGVLPSSCYEILVDAAPNEMASLKFNTLDGTSQHYALSFAVELGKSEKAIKKIIDHSCVEAVQEALNGVLSKRTANKELRTYALKRKQALTGEESKGLLSWLKGPKKAAVASSSSKPVSANTLQKGSTAPQPPSHQNHAEQRTAPVNGSGVEEPVECKQQ